MFSDALWALPGPAGVIALPGPAGAQAQPNFDEAATLGGLSAEGGADAACAGESAAEGSSSKRCRGKNGGKAAGGAEEGARVNAAILEYLQDIKVKDTPAAVSGRSFSGNKACQIVGSARSPIDPDNIHVLRFFGERGLSTLRVRGHFRNPKYRPLVPGALPLPENPGTSASSSSKPAASQIAATQMDTSQMCASQVACSQIDGTQAEASSWSAMQGIFETLDGASQLGMSQDAQPADAAAASDACAPPRSLKDRVREEIDSLLAAGELDGRRLTSQTRRGLQETRDGLKVFLTLKAVKDVALIRTCSPELAKYLKETVKALPKPKAPKAPKEPTQAKAGKRVPGASMVVEQEGVEPEEEDGGRKIRPKKKLRGRRAVKEEPCDGPVAEESEQGDAHRHDATPNSNCRSDPNDGGASPLGDADSGVCAATASRRPPRAKRRYVSAKKKLGPRTRWKYSSLATRGLDEAPCVAPPASGLVEASADALTSTAVAESPKEMPAQSLANEPPSGTANKEASETTLASLVPEAVADVPPAGVGGEACAPDTPGAVGAEVSRVPVGAAGATLSKKGKCKELKPKKQLKACKAFSGGWAIMLGLHIAGDVQTKAQLVEMSALRGLCREPLVKLQRSVGRKGQWYDAWSSCSRLRKIGWVERRGIKYALTEKGKVEAQTYAEEYEKLRGQPLLLLPRAPDAEGSNGAEASTPAKGTRGKKANLSKLTPLAKRPRMGATVGPQIKSQAEGMSTMSAGVAANSDATDERSWVVLVDTAEKRDVRSQLKEHLTSMSELRLPGVDYAFGRRPADGSQTEWELADVVLERKTVHDFFATITSGRAQFQAKVHACLRQAGFRVAILLEGVKDQNQHPLQAEFLISAYAGEVDLLTTTSIENSAQLLRGIAAGARRHDGWTMSSLRELLKPLYEPSPVEVCTAALGALGLSKPICQGLAKGYGSLAGLLAQLPCPGEDVEEVVESIASCSGLTLYQAGKVLQSLGVDDVPLLRRHAHAASKGEVDACPPASTSQEFGDGAHVKSEPGAEEHGRPAVCWKYGVLQPLQRRETVEVGFGTHDLIMDSLRVRLQVKVVRKLRSGYIRVRRGDRHFDFAIGDIATPLKPGRHWLILPDGKDWRSITYFSGRAWSRSGIVSSLCASPDQAARHVAACVAAFGRDQKSQQKMHAKLQLAKKEGGLTGVLGMTRVKTGTMGGYLSLGVAEGLARRLRHENCVTLAALFWRLQEHGPESLVKLGVPDFHDISAVAIRSFLLGGPINGGSAPAVAEGEEVAPEAEQSDPPLAP